MRPEELTDQRLDEALRRQPRWEPPRHFARAVVARMPDAAEPLPWIEPPRLPGIVDAMLTGLSGAGLAYLGGMTLLAVTPALVANAALVGWIGAAAGLLVAAAVTGRAEEWI
jgi:hypothetical protein